MAKTTLATIKSFIRKNAKDLYVKKTSDFDGMTDCIQPTGNTTFEKVSPEDIDFEDKRSYGISGAWFVGSSKNYFYDFSDIEFKGFRVSNCCGSFILVTKDI